MSHSDHRRHHQAQLVGREKPLHAIFGAGKVADMLSWKNKTLSAAMLTGFTAIWLLFEVFEYHFVSLLCHLLILIMLLVFFWSKLTVLAKWDPPNVHGFEISEPTVRYLFDKLNWLLLTFIEISYGDDFKLFVMAIASLWLFSVIGGLASSLNLIYIVFLCLQILPILYEKFEKEVDQLAAQANSYLKDACHSFDSHVLSKIPRGPAKHRQ